MSIDPLSWISIGFYRHESFNKGDKFTFFVLPTGSSNGLWRCYAEFTLWNIGGTSKMAMSSVVIYWVGGGTRYARAKERGRLSAIMNKISAFEQCRFNDKVEHLSTARAFIGQGLFHLSGLLNFYTNETLDMKLTKVNEGPFGRIHSFSLLSFGLITIGFIIFTVFSPLNSRHIRTNSRQILTSAYSNCRLPLKCTLPANAGVPLFPWYSVSFFPVDKNVFVIIINVSALS